MKIVSVLSERNESLSINNFGYENKSEDAHWGRGRRDMWILHFVLSGEGYFNSHRIKTGEGFLIRPMELHEYHSSKDAPWCYLYIIFSGDTARTVCDKYVEADSYGKFTFNLADLTTLKEMIFSSQSIINHTRSLGYFFQIISSISSEVTLKTNGYVQEAKKYIETNLYRPFSVSEVARSIGINDRYLYNLFIANEGCSVKSYINNLKISYSSKLLKTTAYSISEIAFSVGFTDVLAFSKFFKKSVGTSPKEYRNKA